MVRFLVSTILFWSFSNLIAQDTLQKKHLSLFADTGVTSSDYITYMESSIQKLSAIRSSAKLGYKVLSIRNDLPQTDTTIKIIKESLKYGKHLDVRDLQMFEILAVDVQKKLSYYKKQVDSTAHRLSNASDNMKAMRNDTIWQELRKDTSAKKAFNLQFTELRKRWRIADSTLRTNIKILDELTIHIATNTIINAELRDQIDGQIHKLSKQSFTKEQHYLWEKRPVENTKSELEHSADTYYRGEKEAVTFYIKENSAVRILMLAVGMLFFLWVNKNFRQLNANHKEEVIKNLNIRYISLYPITATLIVVLNLSPFFDLTPPAVFITFMQFMLMLVLTGVFYRKWQRPVFLKWCTIVVLYLLLLCAHLISSSSVLVRYWFLMLTLASVAFGIFFFREQDKTDEFPKYVRWVTVMYILFNLLSVIFNISGRWTLTQLFATSAVFGLAQIIGLSVFIRICVEAFTINIVNARIVNDLSDDFDFHPFIQNIQKAFTYVSIILWVMVLASNLNIYNFLYDRILVLLTTPRNMGSISFNVGSILLFFIIIWVSGVLQKYISYLFGDSGAEISKVNKKQHSKLLLARLVLLTAGFLLAVAASGLPVDKITIILGALGVGIGLGLQNIVNNFVSGVILIFERPFQVGDSIEIGTRKGKVKEIGIRHSILLTQEGGEVIVPNGDMLSNQIMNWTLSNDYIRIEVPLKVEANEKWKTVSESITEMVSQDDRVLPSREPFIVLNNISGNIIDFKILVWCKDFYRAESLKSDLINLLYTTLKTEGIEIK